MTNTMQDLFKTEREQWIDDARSAARRLLIYRDTITIEDVLAICPRPTYVHRNVSGQLFKHEDFKAKGFTKSRRAVSKGRWIMTWQLNAKALPHMMKQIRRAAREAE